MMASDLARLEVGHYPGGKSGAGVYQKIINLMPPHQVYIEPFLGGGSVLRRKRPAQHNIGIDLDPAVIAIWGSAAPQESQATAAAGESFGNRRATSRNHAAQASTSDPAAEESGKRSRAASSSVAVPAGNRWEFHCTDGIDFLRRYPWTGCELVYCDPPYLHETRRDLKLYGPYELSESRHIELLDVLRGLPVPVLLSGYMSDLYSTVLRNWELVQFNAMTRRGVATESLWCNFPPPVELHDYRYLGEDRRQREAIKRKQASWSARIARLSPLERQALLGVLASTASERGGAARPESLQPKQRGAPAPSKQHTISPSSFPNSPLISSGGN